jgi:hypothetical protein
MEFIVMSKGVKLFSVSLLAIVSASAAALAFPLQSNTSSETSTLVQRVECEDCWHSRWRSHYRFGSYDFYCHSRWRSHFRLGSYGGGCAYGPCSHEWAPPRYWGEHSRYE